MDNIEKFIASLLWHFFEEGNGQLTAADFAEWAEIVGLAQEKTDDTTVQPDVPSIDVDGVPYVCSSKGQELLAEYKRRYLT